MARFDLPLLDTSERNKMLGMYRQFSDAWLPPELEQSMIGSYNAAEDQYLQEAYHAAQLASMEEYLPQMEAARRRSFAYGDLSNGAPARRGYEDALRGAMNTLSTRRFQAGADSAARKAAYLRSIADQKLAARQGIMGQTYGQAMAAKQKPTGWQQATAAGLQVGGALGGAALGKPSMPSTNSSGTTFNANEAPSYMNPEKFWGAW